jgi:hypothetical protein
MHQQKDTQTMGTEKNDTDKIPLKPGDDAAPGTPGTGENVCPLCAGSGMVHGDSCARCLGTGIVQEGIGGG